MIGHLKTTKDFGVLTNAKFDAKVKEMLTYKSMSQLWLVDSSMWSPLTSYVKSRQHLCNKLVE
jgi:hypothetical protein